MEDLLIRFKDTLLIRLESFCFWLPHEKLNFFANALVWDELLGSDKTRLHQAMFIFPFQSTMEGDSFILTSCSTQTDATTKDTTFWGVTSNSYDCISVVRLCSSITNVFPYTLWIKKSFSRTEIWENCKYVRDTHQKIDFWWMYHPH